MYISTVLKDSGIHSVLVGGSCVSIYTSNQYQSYDLDFVSFDRLKDIKKALETVGFKYDAKKYFKHEDCDFFIEFVTPPVSIGSELVKDLHQIKSENGVITLLSPTDCVKDRLAAYYHWNDRESLEQALMVANSQPVDLSVVEAWSKKENSLEKFKEFENRFLRRV